jgi:hypothetical protein
MPAIFDLLYREYCRSRLAEMRKQLLIQPKSGGLPQTNCDACHCREVSARHPVLMDGRGDEREDNRALE